MTSSFIAHGLSQTEIADESMLQLYDDEQVIPVFTMLTSEIRLAGSDTTATILRTGFLSVITNPQIYARLQSECLSADIPLSSIISNAHALQLPYLQACVKEALRHNPAATGLLPRVVGPKGDTHNGIYLPPGTEVGFCAWNISRNNTSAYGEDAHIFRPERWLEASPERLARMEEAFHLVFGFGRFRCMGENIAKIELNKMFFEMFRRFDWSLINPLKPLEKNMNYGLFIQKGMWVKVSEKHV